MNAKVTITYCDEYGVWPLIADDLSSRLPLKNLTWRPSSQRSERYIQTLDVDLKRFTFEQIPQPLPSTQSTYLNLYFVVCEDNDTYKNKVKLKIKAWMEAVANKKNQEWLIVYAAGHDTKRSNTYLGLKTSVFDKIRTDFNHGKQDRCAFIRVRDPAGPMSDLWSGFIEKIKTSILSSFDMYVTQIEEDARRLDTQRHMPGWNYCTFFILKEKLAQTFELLTLYEDALIQYDELEASFFQVLRDKALAWFGHFGGASIGDDSGNVLDFKRKDYRDMIIKNDISVFDFRSYLFARQCRMLMKLQRVVEVCKRAQMFITSLIPSIRENKALLPKHFLQSWVFSACMNVVNECEPVFTQLSAVDPNLIPPFNSVKGDLLLSARRQLDTLGLVFDRLPDTTPFNINGSIEQESADEENESEASPQQDISNKKLLEACDSVEAFDKMYMALSTRAIKCYDASKRPRAALCVHGDIAALKHIREKYDEAVRIYESFIWRYGEQDWNKIESSLLIKYVESTLALLKNSSAMNPTDATHYTDELLENVRQLTHEIKRPFSPMFSVALVRIIDDDTTDSSSIEVTVTNRLPKDIHFDRLSLRLVGNDPEQIHFKTENATLQVGKNTLLLTSDVSTHGNYVVEACEMHVGRLVFTHNFLRPGQKKRMVRLNHDTKQLCVKISQPTTVRLGESPLFTIYIDGGSTGIKAGKLLLESQTEGMQMTVDKSLGGHLTCADNDATEVEQVTLDATENGEISIPAIGKNQKLEFQVAYECSYTDHDYRVKSTLSYETPSGISRQFISADVVRVSVPLVVTESCIFRESWHVELTCNGELPVRIFDCHLEPSRTHDIIDQPSTPPKQLILFPKQSAAFIYKLAKGSADNQDVKQSSKVIFHVQYRTLQQEVETSTGAMLKKKLEANDLGQHFDYVFTKVREAFLSPINYTNYGLTGVVQLDDFDAELCESFLLYRDLKTKVALLDLIEEFFQENESISKEALRDAVNEQTVHEITFPLDVPTSKTIHMAELELSVDSDLYVSEVCPCTLRIRQDTYWSPSTGDQTGVAEDFYYNIEADYDTWLVYGKRRLRFTSKPGDEKSFPITLIPLKTGHLLLPRVHISSVSPDIYATTVYSNSAQQTLVKPRSKTATFHIDQQQRFLQQPALNSQGPSPDVVRATVSTV